ncbi:MAG: DNA repair protein RecN [Flavobacteriaceae bacterium]|nr:DNA repair protein RecN [Flavobacteriaceae bacterium]
MLTSLSIKNYALIDNLSVDFNNGLSIITGETGAGKSILLGGLSLVLGKRADLSSVKNKSEKCIIEAVFDIANYNLKQVFLEQDLDYEPQTIIRREILPSGKSRAFVNDTPVNLDALQALSNYLIDIHSQHQTLELTNNQFQFKVIDALAKNSELLRDYKHNLENFKALNVELKDLKSFQSEAIKEQDYNLFLMNELEEANLVKGALEILEEEYESLNNVEEIKEKLSQANQLLNDDQLGILSSLTDLKNTIQKLSNISNKYQELFNRINGSLIELDDVYLEIENMQDQLDADPNRLEEVNSKLQIIHNLFQKHNSNTIDDLLTIKTDLSQKVQVTENIDSDISELESKINGVRKMIIDLAKQINQNRKKAIPELVDQLHEILVNLGIPNAQFELELKQKDEFYNNGSDELSFLFSANKGSNLNELKKTASGGELSRIMLAIKYILSKHVQMPTIMFDEIDSGVSGEISNMMAQIMKKMSKSMQVFTITHLPQIAAKGDVHFRVFKEVADNKTHTNLVRLNQDERIVEIAQMLGGNKMTDSAVIHAKSLLQ